ncbi:hypothetical protein B0T16DRAFT_424797 [Cercophora newfieldiana]|uniref:G-patch domain-containing protein n=1 Tax=Cercophora newfieldiana TaxID=92897 RepID=A0AA39YP53_9PEZI|nr:hypothetical protein B0T16DRAFT_424797 [Cercophora newfieldiana]
MTSPHMMRFLAPNPTTKMADSDSEEDYMKMTFTDAPSSTSIPAETSLQRRLRLRREAEQRSRPKSKAELAEEETARREAALSKPLLDTTTSSNSASQKSKSKGLAMMAKMGFTGGALGRKYEDGKGGDDRVTEPIRVVVKDGREGIGLESERKRKLREAAEAAGEAAKKARVDEEGYRERVRREREEARLERQVNAAQKVAERMDDEEAVGGEGKGVSSRPLRSVPVVYRALVKGREEAERERRMRHDLEQASLSRLPVYDGGDEDEDDKRALGKEPAHSTKYVTADDLDDEDPELDDFNALPLEERLGKIVQYLRDKHRYCFWCKFAYPDAEMDGCPGLTEEDHD